MDAVTVQGGNFVLMVRPDVWYFKDTKIGGEPADIACEHELITYGFIIRKREDNPLQADVHIEGLEPIPTKWIGNQLCVSMHDNDCRGKIHQQLRERGLRYPVLGRHHGYNSNGRIIRRPE